MRVMRPRAIATGWLVLLGGAVIVFRPLLGSAFFVVTFDDDAFVLENPLIRSISWSTAVTWFTRFYHADYVPLALASFALDYRLWGLWPGGYHLTNIAIHLVTVFLVGDFVAKASRRREISLLAAALFCFHPLQLEAVAIVSQRKTLLATALALASLNAYQRYLVRRGWGAYAAAAALFAFGGLAKASIAPLPLLLWLLEWQQERRLRLWNKLPFFLVASAIAFLGIASRASADVIKAPHGGSLAATALLMGRVWAEYVAAFFVPARLSAAYYYAPSMAYSPWHALASLLVLVGHWAMWRQRHRLPLAFLGLFWFTASMLPAANIVPIAVVRADRYAYLAMVGPVWWAAEALLPARSAAGRPLLHRCALAACVVGALAGATSTRIPSWKNDVAVWERVVHLHPWNARARYLLARAYRNRGDSARALALSLEAARIDPAFAAPHFLAAEILASAGRPAEARAEVQRGLALDPHAPVPAPPAPPGEETPHE